MLEVRLEINRNQGVQIKKIKLLLKSVRICVSDVHILWSNISDFSIRVMFSVF